MNSQQAYLDVVTSSDKLTFEKRLVDFAARKGFPLVSAILVLDRPAAPAQFISIGNVPDAYKASYNDPELSRKSPVLTRLKHLAHPFTYDQSLYVKDGAGHLWEHQAQYGYKTGVAMAMHMSNGRHFLLGFDRDEALPDDDRELIGLMADLQLLGAFAQETAVRLLTPLAAPEVELPVLTARELEILRWTSGGKSAEVIGNILGLNRGTINFHLQSASKKLGVSGKHAAVAKAIQLGLL
ncbi:helix-turn-helix transcriptional regulator [Rubrivivax rivuli]|uniref:LuxR family transcriptional regulator n=1 Tax=Rubrivivax rivuli TaxID=1862385 RepID=A0A437RGZ7_9BURK|nr:autoinducer binding domain-containing protein [Rubrivivax rivuli]RVU46008.1 LuxR family transcriptional regulator [Rubrivivax rivuli]